MSYNKSVAFDCGCPLASNCCGVLERTDWPAVTGAAGVPLRLSADVAGMRIAAPGREVC
jgi:hypothetical protein